MCKVCDERDGNLVVDQLPNESLPIPARDIAIAAPMFDEFYAAYPRKVGRGQARTIWIRHVVRRGLDTVDIVRAAERFAVECKDRGTQTKFIPHPASWLSNERWADEPEQDAQLPAPVTVKASPELAPKLNVDEVVLATVIRLADPKQPITAAQAIVRYVSTMIPVLNDPWPAVTRERAAELAKMPYPEYLLTPEWRARRVPMLKQAGHRCQVCYGSDRLHVHHRTYERRGNELPSDLIVLCEGCHDLFHENRKLVKEA